MFTSSIGNPFLFDARFLAGDFAEVIQFCATYFTALVDGDTFDERRIHRKIMCERSDYPVSNISVENRIKPIWSVP